MKKLMMLAVAVALLAGCETTRDEIGKAFWDDSKTTASNVFNLLLLPLSACPPICP